VTGIWLFLRAVLLPRGPPPAFFDILRPWWAQPTARQAPADSASYMRPPPVPASHAAALPRGSRNQGFYEGIEVVW